MSLGASDIYHTGGGGAEVTGINNVLAFVHVNGTGCTGIHMSGGDRVKKSLSNPLTVLTQRGMFTSLNMIVTLFFTKTPCTHIQQLVIIIISIYKKHSRL